MTDFNRIVAATDLSDHARAAAERAARIAVESGRPLHLVQVTQVALLERLRNMVTDGPQPIADRVLNADRFGLEVLAKTLAQSHGITAEVHNATGDLLTELRQAAGPDGALLVLGARGASAARHLLLGSTAERLLAGARDPMLVVRLPAEVHWRRVLVPVDFSPASLRSLRQARALAPAARIFVLHAYEAPFEGKLRQAGLDEQDMRQYVEEAMQDAQRRMTQLLDEAALPGEVEPLLRHGHPVPLVLDQQEELDCQLLVVGKDSGGPLEDFLLGSVARRLLGQSSGDVLLSV